MNPVLVEIDGHIATVVLNRPDRRNALDLAAWRAFGPVMDDISRRTDIGCVVLRGAGGRAFCAGHDLSRFGDERRTLEQVLTYSGIVKRVTDAIRDCPHATVAMIQGPCMGAGVQLMTNCDIRLAAASARIALTPAKVGLFLEYELVNTLVAVVGRATALEMVLEGRAYDGREAVAKGLVSRVFPDEELERETVALATTLADAGKDEAPRAIARRRDL